MTTTQWVFLSLMALAFITLGVLGSLLWRNTSGRRLNAVLSIVFSILGLSAVLQLSLVGNQVRKITENTERRFNERLACTQSIVEVLEIRSDALLTQKRKNVELGKSEEWLDDLELAYRENPLPQC